MVRGGGNLGDGHSLPQGNWCGGGNTVRGDPGDSLQMEKVSGGGNALGDSPGDSLPQGNWPRGGNTEGDENSLLARNGPGGSNI